MLSSPAQQFSKMCFTSAKFNSAPLDVKEINGKIYEEVWDLSSLNVDFEGYYGQTQVNELNTNYLKPLKLVYDHYLASDQIVQAQEVRNIALSVASRTEDEALIERADSLFRNH